MPKLVARAISMSLDGFCAGPAQDLQNPMGLGGRALHGWAFATKTFRKMFGQEGGSLGLDEDYAKKADEGIGATLMGRNMFGPVRGPWPDMDWKGWWGDEPPYHHPVFVLTHHGRDPLPMQGGTTFHFVTDGLESGVKQAFQAAQGKDVRVGGGASVLRQCMQAGLLDELHLVISPVLLGSGERLFEDFAEAAKHYAVSNFEASEAAMHVILKKGLS
jgi:dihydrofolate reductase